MVLTKKIAKQLQDISDLAQHGEMEAALVQTRTFNKTHPSVVEGWMVLSQIAQEIDNAFLGWLAGRNIIRLNPSDEMGLYNLLVNSLSLDCVFYAKVHIERYLKRFPEGLFRDTVREMQAETEKDILLTIQAGLVPPNLMHVDMAIYEESKTLMSHGEFHEALQLGLKAVQKLPDFAPAWNNLILVYTIGGDFNKALEAADKSLSVAPDNVHGLGNKAHVLVKLGRQDEALTLLERMCRSKTRDANFWSKVFETCALTHQHQRMIDLYEELQRNANFTEYAKEPALLKMISTAYAWLGNEKKAITNLREFYKAMGMSRHLADLMPLEFEVPCYLDITMWLPQTWYEEILSALYKPARDEMVISKRLMGLFAKYPLLLNMLSRIFERGSGSDIGFLLNLCEYVEIPGLVAFAQGMRGIDDLRYGAADIAVRSGVYGHGQPIRLFTDKKWVDVRFYDFEIEFEVSKPLNADFITQVKQVKALLDGKKWDEAQALLITLGMTKKLHILEFEALAHTFIIYFTKQKNKRQIQYWESYLLDILGDEN